MSDFVMPSLGADMEQGTVVRWLVKPGDSVKRGAIILEIETEKSDMEVESFQDGIVEEILVHEGETVAVGTPLARIGTGATATVQPATPAVAAAAAGPVDVSPPAPAPAPASLPTTPDVELQAAAAAPPPAPKKATPLARREAEQLHVDIERVEGTGPHGAVTREDVERAAAATARPRVTPYARRLAAERGVDVAGLAGTGPDGAVSARDVLGSEGRPPVPSEPAAVPPAQPKGTPDTRAAARQRAVARLMARSKREIPHYYLQTTVDVSGTLAWLQRENERRPLAERLLLAGVLIRAVALAARDVPGFNGFYEDETFTPSEPVNVGVAISLRDGGLVTPAILGAEALPLDGLMAALLDLVSRARANRLRASEMAGGTITVTNLGDQGVELVYGVIYPPQVAILGFGRPVERPWAEGGLLGVRTVLTATLAADHRVTNGHRGGQFLNAVTRYIQHPELL